MTLRFDPSFDGSATVELEGYYPIAVDMQRSDGSRYSFDGLAQLDEFAKSIRELLDQLHAKVFIGPGDEDLAMTLSFSDPCRTIVTINPPLYTMVVIDLDRDILEKMVSNFKPLLGYNNTEGQFKNWLDGRAQDFRWPAQLASSSARKMVYWKLRQIRFEIRVPVHYYLEVVSTFYEDLFFKGLLTDLDCEALKAQVDRDIQYVWDQLGREDMNENI